MRLKCSEQTIDENMILYMIFVWMTNIEFLFRRIGSFFEILKACNSLNQLYDILRFIHLVIKENFVVCHAEESLAHKPLFLKLFLYRFMVHRSVAEYILHTHIYFLSVYYIPRFFFSSVQYFMALYFVCKMFAFVRFHRNFSRFQHL